MLDIFKADGFSLMSMTAAVNKADFLPALLLAFFAAEGVTTTTVAIEEMGGTLALVQTVPRNGVPTTPADDKRVVRDFRVPHLPMQDRIWADEVQGIRAFGSATAVEMLQDRVNRRMGKLRRNIELTQEYHRLGAVTGTILDADGSTIYDLFAQFGISQESTVDFDLDNAAPASGALRTVCNGIVRTMRRNLKGMAPPQLQVIALCGDTFFDLLTAHSEVRATYLNQVQAAELRTGMAFGSLQYGGITFINYQGTDDNSTVAVSTHGVQLFPGNVPGLFRTFYAPANYEETVNTVGMPFYSKQVVPQEGLGKYALIEVQSNPLSICTVPAVLMVGTDT